MNISMRTRSIVAVLVAGVVISAAPAAASGNDPLGTSQGTAQEPQGGQVILRRDGSKAEPFFAQRRSAVVLRRDGSKAEPLVANVGPAPPSADGFDWGDAAIGTGAGIAGALLVAAGSGALRRRRDEAIDQTTAAPHGA